MDAEDRGHEQLADRWWSVISLHGQFRAGRGWHITSLQPLLQPSSPAQLAQPSSSSQRHTHPHPTPSPPSSLSSTTEPPLNPHSFTPYVAASPRRNAASLLRTARLAPLTFLSVIVSKHTGTPSALARCTTWRTIAPPSPFPRADAATPRCEM